MDTPSLAAPALREERAYIPTGAERIRPGKVYLFEKRLFDMVASAAALVVLVIPMLIVAVVIWIDSPGASPIFVQRRVGKDGKEFNLFKFRSMVPHAEKYLAELMKYNEMTGPAFKIKNDPRITRMGRFIRRTSIDELPQLLNILLGEMSFVGPRPPLPREVEEYNDYQMTRLRVKPGLTCYWQIQHDRNAVPFDEWVAMDIRYMENMSFREDMKIIWKTIGVVLHMEGE